MAADDDLFTALKMFGQGVKQYQVQSAIGDANDYVQQLKAADLSDQQKRSELQGLSNQLVMHLSGLGVQSDQVKQAAAAVAPQAFEDADAMNKEALLSGNQQLGDLAQQQKDFEDQGNEADPSKAQATNDRYSTQTTNMFKSYGESLDSTRASSRSAFGATGLALNKGFRTATLMGDPTQYSKMTQADFVPVVEGLNNIVKGGVSTKEEFDLMMPNTRGTAAARLQQFLSNKPTSAQLQNFAAHYKELMDREVLANKSEAADTMLARANQQARIADRRQTEGDFVSPAQQYRNTTATQFQKLGLPVQPEDVTRDKNGVVHIRQLDEANTKADDTAKVAEWAVANVKNKDNPQAATKAATWLKNNGFSSTMPLAQMKGILRKRVKLSIFSADE